MCSALLQRVYMTKVILFVVIFSILAISFTCTMIQINNKSQSANEVSNNKEELSENEESTFKEQNIENITTINKYPGIIIGETKCYENPIDYNMVEIKGKEVEKMNYILDEITGNYSTSVKKVNLENGYYQISGLKNKNVEEKINSSIKQNAERVIEENNKDDIEYKMGKHDIQFNYSNVISIRIGNNYYNYNLIDGEEVKLNDYMNNKGDIKNVLSRRLKNKLLELTGLSNSLDEKGNLLPFIYDYESMDDVKIPEQGIEQINYFIEKSVTRFMSLFEKDEFSIYFDIDNIYLLFNDNNYNEKNSKLFVDDKHYIDIPKSFNVRIPISEIYKDVCIFDRFSNDKDIFEKEISIEKYVGIKDFEKINEDFWWYNSESKDDYLIYVDEDVKNEVEKKRNDVLKGLSKENDKKIVSIFRYGYSQFQGYFYIDYVMKFNKNASLKEMEDIYYLMMNYDDVIWDTQIIGKLENLSDNLKNKYDDIEYTSEQIYFASF